MHLKGQESLNIDYIEFVKRPDGVAKGKTLDLTHTVLRLHMSGETKDINFDEFVNYGIVADPANGTVLTFWTDEDGFRYRNYQRAPRAFR